LLTDFCPQHRDTENNINSSATNSSDLNRKHEKLSQFLHASLPSEEDTRRIYAAARHSPILAHEIITMPYDLLDKKDVTAGEGLVEIPGPTQHPVLISRHMLLLATFLQHLHPDHHEEILGTIEGLECVIIESVYQANIGNLRRSWMSCRRAMNIAQLMGLNRHDNQAQYKVLDPTKEYHPHVMWFRIVFLDRYLCLMLGLSQGCLDRSMASDAMLAKGRCYVESPRCHNLGLSSRLSSSFLC
jgi:hypothetical protein